jgi:hypothetical protein
MNGSALLSVALCKHASQTDTFEQKRHDSGIFYFFKPFHLTNLFKISLAYYSSMGERVTPMFYFNK